MMDVMQADPLPSPSGMEAARPTLRFARDDVARDDVQRLLRGHLQDVARVSPPESTHALSLDELCDRSLCLWTAREGGELRACGALKWLDATTVELKSMRTAPGARRRGIGAAMLDFLLSEAAARGFLRVLLETGSQDFFAPARRLYARHGFVERGPFAAYVVDPNSVFMERRVRPAPAGGA